MTLPNISEQILDGNLNLVQGNAENSMVNVGVCTAGLPLVLQAFGTQNAMTSALGLGSLVEKCAYQLSVSGGPVLALSVPASVAGGLGSITSVLQSGSSGVIDGYAVSHQSVVFTITTGGVLGTAQANYSVNGGPASTPILLPLGGIPFANGVPGTYAIPTFGAGTYVVGDTYTIPVSLDNLIAGPGNSGTPAAGSVSASPIDSYSVNIVCVKAGDPGTAQFTYTLDSFSISPAFVGPSSSNYVIPNAGLAIAFGGSFKVGDSFSFLTTGPSFSGTDVTNAFNQLNSTYLNSSFSLIHVVQGQAFASAANSETQAAAVELNCDALFNNGVDVRTFVECPSLGSVSGSSAVVDTTDTDTNIETAFVNLSADRVCVSDGDALFAMPFSGLNLRRNAAWGISSRVVGLAPSIDGGWVQLGGVPGVLKLFRDEYQTQGLDAARFSTLRTIVGDPGFFITNIKMMASLGSDYAYMTDCRVIDEAATISRAWALPLINSKVPITQNPNAVKGSVAAGFAQKLNASLTSVLNAEIVSVGDAVAAQATVDTNHNILVDGILPITVAVVPYAYARSIQITIGFAVSL